MEQLGSMDFLMREKIIKNQIEHTKARLDIVLKIAQVGSPDYDVIKKLSESLSDSYKELETYYLKVINQN